VDLSAWPGVEKRDGAVRTVLFRVMQEALANTAHHAEATNAWVRLFNRRGTLRMEITDDGKGFVADRAFLAKASTRLGLLGMQERVAMVGGSFSLESSPGVATTIRVDFPPGRTKQGPRTPRTE
jgi:signal transduction histidine kinase